VGGTAAQQEGPPHIIKMTCGMALCLSNDRTDRVGIGPTRMAVNVFTWVSDRPAFRRSDRSVWSCLHMGRGRSGKSLIFSWGQSAWIALPAFHCH